MDTHEYSPEELDAFDAIVEQFQYLDEDTADMTPEEAEAYLEEEFLGALIPAVGKLAPVAGRAFKALRGRLGRGRRGRGRVRRRFPTRGRRPAPRPAYPSTNAVNTLCRLLKDPGVRRMIAQISRRRRGEMIDDFAFDEALNGE